MVSGEKAGRKEVGRGHRRGDACQDAKRLSGEGFTGAGFHTQFGRWLL